MTEAGSGRDARGPGEPEPRSAEGLRRQLRELGYLKNPLEAFVAGRLTGQSGILRTAVLVGTRVGLLGGSLLGLLATAGLLVLLPNLIRAPLDALIVTLHLVFIFAIVSMGIGILGALVLLLLYRATRRFVGRTRAAAQGAGILAGILAFVYLSLLYRKVAPDLPPAASIAAAALLLVVSLLFGRMIAAGSYVFLVRLAGEKPSPSERRVGLMVTGLSIVGVAGFFLYLRATAPEVLEERPAETFTVQATGERLLLVAIDGPTSDLARTAVETDRLPNLRRLLENGSAGLLDVEPGEIPPSFWTSVATGRTPAEHGVRRYSERRLRGMRSPLAVPPDTVGFHELLDVLLPTLRLTREAPAGAFSGAIRTVFDVVGENGGRVGIVNWRASWPAPELAGFVVSDVAYFSILARRALDGKAPLGEDTYPRALLAELEPLAPDPESLDVGSLADGKGAALFPAAVAQGPWLEELRRSLSLDGFACAAAAQLLASQSTDLAAVYLPGLSILERAILAGEPSTASDLRRAAGVMEAYESFLDRCLGRILQAMGERVTVAVATFTDAEDRDGLFVLSGPPVRQGTSCGPISPLDVAPTCLSMLGFPASAEMRGRVIREALTPEFLKSNPERRIGSFGVRPRLRASPQSSDAGVVIDYMKYMKALGYVR